MDFYSLVKEAVTKGASDVHIASGNRPAYRLHGNVFFVNEPALNEAEVTGKNKDGSPIPETPEMTDEDHIRLKATPQKKAGRKGTSSVGPKTGDPAKAKEYLLSAALALFLFIALFLMRDRKEN